MKIINKLRKMSSKELAEFFHYKITSSDCCDCILNNLDKMKFCKREERGCIESIQTYLESKED
ncbi:hypothetical protein SAMN05446037_1002108 [Anaerovirgula multivorans]|uniref:Uncharacterized protein n=1 Tax=Anaerovirgula multivorans TaxID=312168 RepID=A0A239AKP9_9FIRM|nr:hypothetical protein SAMN05446037_1002108 [Anaerovirgula multivorans]